MRRIKSKIKTLSRNQIQSIKGGNGVAAGWNHPNLKGTEEYDRQLDRELADSPCPPPEPDEN